MRTKPKLPKPAAQFAVADLSHDDRRQLLSRSLAEETQNGAWCYLRDVFDTFLTYEDWDDSRTYRRTYSIADDYAVTLGEAEEVMAHTVYDPVKMAAFSLPAGFLTESNVNAYHDSLLFEIRGNSETFTDKGVTINMQDLADIESSFTGASMGLEHMDTVLGDNCGYVTDLRRDSTGRKLFGTVAIPKGLDALIPPGPRKVSVEIFRDEQGKALIPKVDLVLEPRIKNAALMSQIAAFASTGVPPRTIPTTTTARIVGKEQTKTMSFWDKLRATFSEAGIQVPDDNNGGEQNPPHGGTGVTNERPAPATTANFSTAERTELETLRAEKLAQVAAKRDSAKAAAVAAFGQNSPEVKTAHERLDGIADVDTLDMLETAYRQARPGGGNGQPKRQSAPAVQFGATGAPAATTGDGSEIVTEGDKFSAMIEKSAGKAAVRINGVGNANGVTAGNGGK